MSILGVILLGFDTHLGVVECHGCLADSRGLADLLGLVGHQLALLVSELFGLLLNFLLKDALVGVLDLSLIGFGLC